LKKLKLVLVLMFVITTLSTAAFAQERGQYLPGFRGLNLAEQPPPGVTYANYFFWYPANKLKDRNGNSTINVELDLAADMSLLAYAPKKKFLGASYSASIAIPIQNTAVSLPNVGVGMTAGAGLGDIYVEPIALGWKLKKGKIRAGYGFVAPTGRYNVGATNNLSTDFWGHQFAFGGTYNPGKTALWQINAHSVWEVHQTKRHEDVKVGNNVTFEYGFGRTFVKHQGKQLIQVGLVGYSEFQLTDDSGTGVTAFNRRAKDRVNALGGEFGLIAPAKKLNFMVRVMPEYGAYSRTQGVTVVVALGKSF
jgi:hypothetical protein